ncbi:SRPBCC family protein [Kineosporia sp. NBRC 101731]|uniref:SRPBCC family protein n=1 Tax=Kineosporia sp. NBRC 101731 TaxID=3032199 RepID=UPI0024A2D1F9|nr:SRPBCC family protein [Kineosporia sp. NBRC 101731]GLY29753.1 polyketide cyclase [Kineosporia sp. NBRC 101731]
MAVVSRTFSVEPAPDVVVAYLADFGHAQEWDPGTVRCVRVDAGPVQVGSQWRNTSKIAGISTELLYTLEHLSPTRVVHVGRNDTATSTETIEVAPEGTGSSITYTNEVIFNGMAKVASPLAKVIFEKLAGETVERLTGALNAL